LKVFAVVVVSFFVWRARLFLGRREKGWFVGEVDGGTGDVVHN